MARTVTAHYYEHYPHYMGTLHREFSFDIEKMDEIVELLKDPDNMDVHDELADLGDNYALWDVAKDWKSIRKALENKGEWGGEWEEGSHAISMTNMKDARAFVGRIEVEVFERCGEW